MEFPWHALCGDRFRSSHCMALKTHNEGLRFLSPLFFMSVMLSFGLALGSLGYKQQVLASGAIASQYAFYVADTALECALYADQQQGLFAYEKYDGKPKSMTCDGTTVAVVQMPPRHLSSFQLCVSRSILMYVAPT